MSTPSMRSRHAAAVLLITAACGGDAAATADPMVVRDSAGVVVVDNDLTRLSASCAISAEPTVSIGVEEGAEEDMLFRVQGATRLSDGRIALANRGTHQFRLYDTAGRHLRSSGREGRGPGEFSSPFYVHTTVGDTVYVGDFRPFQFLVFAPDGSWVRTVRPMPLYVNTPGTMNVLRDGRMMLSVREDVTEGGVQGGFTPRYTTVVLHAADGTLTDTITRLPAGRWGQTVDDPRSTWVFPWCESFPVLAARGEHLVTGHASTTELRIQRADAGLPLERVIRWSVDDLGILPADLEAEKARVEAQYAELAPADREQFLATLLSDRRPVADRFPAFGRLSIGRDGRLWIREFPRPRDPDEYRWIAFSSDGRFDCRLTTPRFGDLLEFGADYILTHEPDSLGVERVRQYELLGP